MKTILLLFLLLPALTRAQAITPEQAKDSVGKNVTVCGLVTGVKATAKATFINFGGKYPNQVFTAVIFANNASKFTGLAALEGKNVCVTGRVKLYNRKSEIILFSPNQLKKQ